MTKYDLFQGLRVKTMWKGKTFIGVIMGIPKIEAEKSAKITHGRFISIPILNDLGKVLQMPFTSRVNYEKLD